MGMATEKNGSRGIWKEEGGVPRNRGGKQGFMLTLSPIVEGTKHRVSSTRRMNRLRSSSRMREMMPGIVEGDGKCGGPVPHRKNLPTLNGPGRTETAAGPEPPGLSLGGRRPVLLAKCDRRQTLFCPLRNPLCPTSGISLPPPCRVHHVPPTPSTARRHDRQQRQIAAGTVHGYAPGTLEVSHRKQSPELLMR